MAKFLEFFLNPPCILVINKAIKLFGFFTLVPNVMWVSKKSANQSPYYKAMPNVAYPQLSFNNKASSTHGTPGLKSWGKKE